MLPPSHLTTASFEPLWLVYCPPNSNTRHGKSVVQRRVPRKVLGPDTGGNRPKEIRAADDSMNRSNAVTLRSFGPGVEAYSSCAHLGSLPVSVWSVPRKIFLAILDLFLRDVKFAQAGRYSDQQCFLIERIDVV